VLFHQTSGLELTQNAVDRRQADLFIGVNEATVDVVSGEMLVPFVFQNFQYPLAWMGYFETGLSEV
jgi:hypothetical protein